MLDGLNVPRKRRQRKPVVTMTASTAGQMNPDSSLPQSGYTLAAQGRCSDDSVIEIHR